MGWSFISPQALIAWFFPFNLPRLALALPCDTADQTRFILQLTEKRTFRSIPSAITEKYVLISLGLGTGSVTRALDLFPSMPRMAIPWPSEGTQPLQNSSLIRPNVLWFTHPPSPSDWDFTFSQIDFWKPLIITFDLHPKHVLTHRQQVGLKLLEFTTWHWELDCSSIGAPQSRVRKLWFVVSPEYGPCPSKVPLNLLQFLLPTFLDEFLTPFQQHQIVQGTTLLHKPNLTDVLKPIPLGNITLNPDYLQVGHSILFQGVKGVITGPLF